MENNPNQSTTIRDVSQNTQSSPGSNVFTQSEIFSNSELEATQATQKITKQVSQIRKRRGLKVSCGTIL